MRQRNWILTLLVALWPAVAAAQLSPPYVFTAGTVINPDEVNANFALLQNACNRTGCVMTGTLTSRDLVPDATDTRDIGVTGTRYRDLWLSRHITAGGDLTIGGDAVLTRDAANTLAQRNGTNAQAFRLYNTYTDGSNYERALIGWSGNVFYVAPSAAGTGTARSMLLGASMLLPPSGHWLMSADNTYDIGASGANRPRTGYFGTSVLIGDGNALAPSSAFAEDTNTGLWRPSDDVVGIANGGVDSHRFSANFYQIFSNSGGVALGVNSDAQLLYATTRQMKLGPTSGVTLRWSTADTLEVYNFANNGLTAINAARFVVGTNGYSNVEGMLTHSNALGLILQEKQGSSYDLSLVDPTGNNYIMRVPTGTLVPQFPQGLSVSGNVLYGASIMDSVGTPSCTTACSSAVGRDYAFSFQGSSTAVDNVVTFGGTWTNAPVCVASSRAAIGWGVTSSTTTTVTIAPDTAPGAPETVFVLCRGY